MKIFVSWSGELSRRIAETLKDWIPCIIQSVEVFFSPEDIEKGDNWDKTISQELSESNYGIVCLTADNAAAPWINFEAGAIAKTLDSKVTALMINIKPSDIKGPLSRYQATKFEKDDFYQLITSINKSIEAPLETGVLQKSFDAVWTRLEQAVNSIMEEYSKTEDIKSDKDENKDQEEDEPIEEILQLLRKQNSLLSKPEQLLPLEYVEKLFVNYTHGSLKANLEREFFLDDILDYLRYVLEQVEKLPKHSVAFEFLQMFRIEDLLRITIRNAKLRDDKKYYFIAQDMDKQYKAILKGNWDVMMNK